MTVPLYDGGSHTGFSIDFAYKMPVGKIAYRDYMTAGCCTKKSKPVAEHPDCDHVTTRALQ